MQEINNLRNIQWYPGHMAKTRRMIVQQLKEVQLVVEIVDARIPLSSRNPDVDELIAKKPRILVFNKSDMADPQQTAAWLKYCRGRGMGAVAFDSKNGKGVKEFFAEVNRLMAEYIQRRKDKGMIGYTIRMMVVGVPNVGKSSFINRISRSNRAKVEDRPGVTRDKQLIKVKEHIQLLDTPGILWPKFEDQTVGEKLAFTGAIKDDTIDIEYIAAKLSLLLLQIAPDQLVSRYKLRPEQLSEENGGYTLLENIGRRRGMLISGGEVDLKRAAITLLDEYRAGKLGRLTLERVQEHDINGI